MIFLLLGCGAPDAGALLDADTAGVAHARAYAADWEDPLDPDTVHVLASSLVYASGDALVELRADLSEAWSLDLGEEGGAQGAARLEDGSTVYAYSGAPPAYRSRFDRVDAEGAVVWSYDRLVAVGFSHGVLPTPEGDYIALDTVAGDVFAFDDRGVELWRMGVSEAGEDFHPNGLSLARIDGETRIAVSMLERSTDDAADALATYTLGERTELPTRRWRIGAATPNGDGVWTHGPRLLEDGTVLLCHSATGQVVAYDSVDGVELWRAPPDGAPAQLAFPRDVLPLSDGSYVFADAGAEIVRVVDPRGEFRVVGAVAAPGVFGLSPIPCAEGAPCFGLP